MELYLAIKKNEIMLFAGKWTELEIIILTKISQSHKENYHIFSYVWKLRDMVVKMEGDLLSRRRKREKAEG
jgi:hypothetical protein